MEDVTVPFQGRVPLSLVVDLQRKLNTVSEHHTAQIAKLKDPDKLAVYHRAGKRLTINNLMRLAFVHGAKAVVQMAEPALIDALSSMGLARGRPRTRAA